MRKSRVEELVRVCAPGYIANLGFKIYQLNILVKKSPKAKKFTAITEIPVSKTEKVLTIILYHDMIKNQEEFFLTLIHELMHAKLVDSFPNYRKLDSRREEKFVQSVERLFCAVMRSYKKD